MTLRRSLTLALAALALLASFLPAHSRSSMRKEFKLTGAAGQVEVAYDAEDNEQSVELEMKGAKAGQPYRLQALVAGKWVDLATAKAGADGVLTMQITDAADDADEIKLALPPGKTVSDLAAFKVYQGQTVVAEAAEK